METFVEFVEKPKKLKKPILIEGLPGIGNVGRVAAGYMVSELKMKKLADIYSQHFLPLVLLHDDAVAHMLKNELYVYYGKKKDILVLTGDTQSMTPEGHYHVCEAIINVAEKLGVKDIITLGGFTNGEEVANPRVIGAVSEKELVKTYNKYGIMFGKDHQIGTIVGASGLLIGFAKLRKMHGLCLMGETAGVPFMTDPRAADRVLSVLRDILGIKLDLTKLEKTIKQMEVQIKKTDKIHQSMLQELSKTGKDESIRYIG
ncbi:MAG: proteasome assembly chaperone family protein [Candidatus Aenigmarchaeota archaeon]|nr:proteasome assembly chaperone family protein [Candidatus Aenigmarchaeota archaeon]